MSAVFPSDICNQLEVLIYGNISISEHIFRPPCPFLAARMWPRATSSTSNVYSLVDVSSRFPFDCINNHLACWRWLYVIRANNKVGSLLPPAALL